MTWFSFTSTDPKSKTARAELRVRPKVQGAALVLDNKTGRILAMAGGFSYPLSQLNRTTQSQRQPGSALKPLTYLTALQKGLQPNTMVRDQEITLPPIGGGIAREQDYWTPKNYDRNEWGVVTLRRALENSRNLATVNLLEGGIDIDPHSSLDRICALALEAQVYRECVPYYPFVLGAQPVRPIDLAPFYAAIANEGVRPTPYGIESIEHNGLVVYRHEAATASRPIASADRVSFFQLKTMLQGVLARGTAHAISRALALCGGQDRHHRRRERRLVHGLHQRRHGGGVGGLRQCRRQAAHARRRRRPAPAWRSRYSSRSSRRSGRNMRPRPRSIGPSAEAKRELVARPINLASGEPAAGGANAKSFVEYFRRDRRRRALRYAIPAGVARRGLYGARNARRRRHAGIPAAIRQRRTLRAAVGTLAGAAGL